MAQKCLHRTADGVCCKRWANRGAQFCRVHLTPLDLSRLGLGSDPDGSPGNGPSPEDVLAVLSESISAANAGRMSSSQAHSIGCLVTLWLKTFELKRGEEQRVFAARLFDDFDDDEAQV